jgi:hypothetical protein
MARSLTVNHQEAPATNPLLSAFLVLAVLVMLAQTFVGYAADRAPDVRSTEAELVDPS